LRLEGLEGLKGLDGPGDQETRKEGDQETKSKKISIVCRQKISFNRKVREEASTGVPVLLKIRELTLKKCYPTT
jgi:hypothetical protein